MDIPLLKTPPTKLQLCHIRSLTFHHLATTLQQPYDKVVIVWLQFQFQDHHYVVTRLSQPSDKVVINLVNKLVTATYKLVFIVWDWTTYNEQHNEEYLLQFGNYLAENILLIIKVNVKYFHGYT